MAEELSVGWLPCPEREFPFDRLTISEIPVGEYQIIPPPLPISCLHYDDDDVVVRYVN